MRAETQERKGASVADDFSGERLRISEIYASLQGEGRWTGVPSVFLRTSGCNLRCWFCDTPFASWHPEGESMTVEEVVSQVLKFPENDVVVTGGEPMLFSGIAQACARLRAAGRRITIETAGTVDQKVECDLLSISPKLSSSAPNQDTHPRWHELHNQRRQRMDLVRAWINQRDCQLKFVVGDLADANEVLNYLVALNSAQTDQVWIMPEGTTTEILDERAEWLVPWCNEHGFHFCQRSHIYWYGNRRGT